MKKLLTIALCIVFVGVMAVSAFADAPEYADHGQIAITLAEGTAPEVDGVISEGEYQQSYEAVIGEANDAVYEKNPELADATFVNFYLTATADCLYIATETDDANVMQWDEGLFFFISANNTDEYVRVFLTNPTDNIEVEGGNEEIVFTYNVGKDNGKFGFEVGVSRSVLAEALGVETADELLVSVAQLVDVSTGTSSTVVWGWGFELPGEETAESAELPTPYPYPAYGRPHVVEIVAGGAQAPADNVQTPADDDQAPADDVQTPADDVQTPADDAQTSEAKGGCGASVAAACVAMIAALGTCVAFVTKK